MPRISIPTRDEAPEGSRLLLDDVYRKLGVAPGVFRLIANNPSVLKGYCNFADALTEALDEKIRMRIALAVSQANGSDYCLSANRYLSLNFARLRPEEVELSRRGLSSDPRAAAAVQFATRIVQARGRVSDEDLAELRAAGFVDSDAVAIIAFVSLCTFTNYLNEAAQTPIDFPIVRSSEVA